MKENYKIIEDNTKSKIDNYSDQELLRNRAICERILTLFSLKDSNVLSPDQANILHETTIEFHYIEKRLGNL